MTSVKAETKFVFDPETNRFLLIINDRITGQQLVDLSFSLEHYHKLISSAVETYEIYSGNPFPYTSIYEYRDTQ